MLSRYLQLRQLDMDANVASTNRLPCVSLFLLVHVKCFGDFSTMHRLKKFFYVYLKIYSQGYTPTPFNVTYHMIILLFRKVVRRAAVNVSSN